MTQDNQNKAIPISIVAGLSLLAFLAYLPVLGAGFINYDDPFYVTANSRVLPGLSPESIRWAFSTFYNYNWHPVTWLSHMLDVQLFGLNPAWHHLVNLLLHIANSTLLFLLLQRMTNAVWKSACVAALFALHPLHVESVAWISERKDLLSTMFGFLAISAYVEFARSRKAGAYALCALLFGIGLMAKPMLITLPFVLLLLDYWPLGRLGRDNGGEPLPRLLLEKLPLAGLSLISVAITFLAQKQGGAMPGGSSIPANAGNAVISYAAYIMKMFRPAGLAVFYPFDPAAISAGRVALSLALILLISVLTIRAARQRPWLGVGWLWYLGTLVPVIGFIRIGQQAMADRYTYVPLIGLFIMVVWGGAELAERTPMPRTASAAVMATVLALCALLTYQQAGVWRDSATLFSHALEVTDNNWLAHRNLGNALANRGEFELALGHVSESLRIRPEAPEYVSQGWLYLKLRQPALALEAGRKALAMAPESDKAHFILGLAAISLNDYRAAQSELESLRGLNSPYAAQLSGSLEAAGPAAPGSGK